MRYGTEQAYPSSPRAFRAATNDDADDDGEDDQDGTDLD